MDLLLLVIPARFERDKFLPSQHLLNQKMFSNEKENLAQRSLGDLMHKPAITYGGPLKLSANSPSILAEILQTAAQTPQSIVYIQPDKSEKYQSYQDLFLEAQRILHGLRKLGLQPQDKVVLQIESYQDFISAFWGCGRFCPSSRHPYCLYTRTSQQNR